jgi:thiamine-monophosphate kinase
MSSSISSLGERALIARLQAHFHGTPDYVRVGIGDDAAVLAADRGTELVLTTDSLVEGVHFSFAWSSPEDVGYKALAVNLSDLAAMGARPRASLLSLALPADLSLDTFDRLVAGYANLSTETHTPLVGGNITRTTGPAVIDVTAIGTVRPRRRLLRSGAAPGDEVWVTGLLGAASAGLAYLASNRPPESWTEHEAACIERQRRPAPRLKAGHIIGKTGAASAAMDLSDGLAQAVLAIAEASRVRIIVEAEALPIHPGVEALAAQQAVPGHAFVLAGAEDYELIFTVPPRRRGRFRSAVSRSSPLPFTRIGRVETGSGAVTALEGGLQVTIQEGFAHFRSQLHPSVL